MQDPQPDPPPLVQFDGSLDGWGAYVEALYGIFTTTLCHRRLVFAGERVTVPRYPEADGKHDCFWHVTTGGSPPADRLPDLRRCERVAWIAWILQRAGTDTRILCWENDRKTRKG